MSNLKDKKCAPCEGGVIPFDISEIHKYQKKVDGWDISKDIKEKFFLNKINLTLSYYFKNLQSLNDGFRAGMFLLEHG
jgi:hypothetical protein